MATDPGLDAGLAEITCPMTIQPKSFRSAASRSFTVGFVLLLSCNSTKAAMYSRIRRAHSGPLNRIRQQINEAVRAELPKTGAIADDGQRLLTLSHRSDITGPDRTWAAMYRPGDVAQYERGSRAEGIERGSFGVVKANDPAMNRMTVELSSGTSVEYDPKRVHGVNVYRETSREFSARGRPAPILGS